MLYASDFRRIARESLNGKWLIAVLTGFIAALLGGSTTGGSSGGSSSNNSANTGNLRHWLQNTETGRFILGWLVGFGVVLLIWIIATIIIGGAVTLGYAKFNLNLVDRREARFEDLFSQFNRIGAGFCMQFLRGLFIFLWALLFIIPGIIASYRYSMTPYIMAEHPEYGALDAIGYSKEMMVGNKWRLFCMQISFIGWFFLCLLTLGIGLLWLNPYIEAANAAFYRDVSQNYAQRTNYQAYNQTYNQ